MNSIYNAFHCLLDLIFVKDIEVDIDKVIDYIFTPDPYHPLLTVYLSALLSPTKYSHEGVTYKDFKCGDYRGIINYLITVVWDSETGRIAPDVVVNNLYLHLNAVIDAFIPVKTIKRSSYPRWFSARLKRLIYEKKRAHKAYKTSNSLTDYWNFSNLRSRCTLLTKMDYREYVDTVECSVQNNVKSFWNFVNAKRGNQGLPANMYYGSSSATSHSAVANLFATYFGSAYTSSSGRSPLSNTNHASFNSLHFNSLSITICDIFSKLNALDINKGPGADGISLLLPKQCSFILSSPSGTFSMAL